MQGSPPAYMWRLLYILKERHAQTSPTYPVRDVRTMLGHGKSAVCGRPPFFPAWGHVPLNACQHYPATVTTVFLPCKTSRSVFAASKHTQRMTWAHRWDPVPLCSPFRKLGEPKKKVVWQWTEKLSEPNVVPVTLLTLTVF